MHSTTANMMNAVQGRNIQDDDVDNDNNDDVDKDDNDDADEDDEDDADEDDEDDADEDDEDDADEDDEDDLNALNDWADRVAEGATSARVLVHLENLNHGDQSSIKI